MYVFFLSDFRLFPLGILSFLSLATAYGIVKMKKWIVWLVAILFLLRTTFGTTTLYALVKTQTDYPNLGSSQFLIVIIAYLSIVALTTIYILAKRDIFKTQFSAKSKQKNEGLMIKKLLITLILIILFFSWVLILA